MKARIHFFHAQDNCACVIASAAAFISSGFLGRPHVVRQDGELEFKSVKNILFITCLPLTLLRLFTRTYKF
jgi:hypothetical protein